MAEIETIPAFSKRMGLPVTLIRQYAKQGLVPTIPVGKTQMRIPVKVAQEAIERMAQNHANELAATMPVPLSAYKMPEKPREPKKYGGRPPGLSKKKLRK